MNQTRMKHIVFVFAILLWSAATCRRFGFVFSRIVHTPETFRFLRCLPVCGPVVTPVRVVGINERKSGDKSPHSKFETAAVQGPIMKHILVLLAFSTLVSTHAIAAEPAKPNIILFLVDDMGWMDSEPYGSKYYDTPHMTRLAKQSMKFTDAYALPLCSPTRASILTGQYSARHGITSATGHQPPQSPDFEFLPQAAPPNQPLRMPISRNYLDPSHYTLAEALKDAGYRAGHFGKWHLGLTEPHWPERHGFDVAFHCEPSAGPPGFYFSPYGVVPPGTEKPKAKGVKHLRGTITDGPDGEYITDRVTDEAIKFIAGNKDQPFFLNLWHYGVHGPWGHKESLTAELAKRTDPTGRQDNPVMASMLKSVDESLGRILDKLDELGIADNTIVIFYSDNGGNTHSMTEAEGKTGRNQSASPSVASYRKWAGYKPPTNNAPLREGKGRIYEGGQRVPLMVRWPGRIVAGSSSDAVVGPIDLYPTILDAVGLRNVARLSESSSPRTPDSENQATAAGSHRHIVDGQSILPVLLGTGTLKRDAYFTWFPHLIPAVSVRQGDWKLIRRFMPHRDYPEVRELYNLKEDIGETKNLAATMPDKVKELDARIDRFVEQTGALYPQPNPAYKPRPSSAAQPPRDPLQGLVPKFCKATLIDGALRIEADGRTPFLGTAQVRIAGPLTLTLRVRGQSGGAGKVQWKTAQQEAFPASGQAADFTVPAGNQWQDITVKVPIDGKPGIVRLYLPAKESPVEIQTIRFSNNRDEVKAWDFTATTMEQGDTP